MRDAKRLARSGQCYQLEQGRQFGQARPHGNAPLTSGQANSGDRLNLSTLPKSSYFLELTDAAGRRTQRLMRE